jgi:hypothetical protein
MMTIPKSKDIELHPDAWARFERATDVVVKAPPQHRVAKKKEAKHGQTKKPNSPKKTRGQQDE